MYWSRPKHGSRAVVALGLGSARGLGAARCRPIFGMTECAMFVAGPPVVKRLGQDLTKQELGGAEIQTRAGGVDDAVDTEEEAFERARRFLSYLPSSVYDLPPTAPCTDDPERAEESLLEAVPRNRRQVYKMRPIIDRDKARLRGQPISAPVSRARAARGRAGAAVAAILHYEGRGRRRRARKWRAGSILRKPSICRWST